MSLTEVLSAVSALPKSEKEKVFTFLQKELTSRDDKQAAPRSITRPEDNCPLTDEEIRAGAKDMTGRTLTEILRSRGLR